MGTWVSPSWNPPKILVLISEVKQRYTIYLVFFFTVDLKQDYEGIFIVFFDVFLVPNITWKKKRRLIRLLAVEKTKFWKSQDLVTKLRETAKASLGEVVYTLGGDELDEFCRSNDCGGVDLVFFGWDLIYEPMGFFWTTFSSNISWREGRFYWRIWLWHSCGLFTFNLKIVLAQWQGIHTIVSSFFLTRLPKYGAADSVCHLSFKNYLPRCAADLHF